MWPTSWTTVSRISRTASPRVSQQRRIGPRKIAIWAGRLVTISARSKNGTPRKIPKSSCSSGVSVSS